MNDLTSEVSQRRATERRRVLADSPETAESRLNLDLLAIAKASLADAIHGAKIR